jgi:ATP-binding cassette subfamily B protein
MLAIVRHLKHSKTAILLTVLLLVVQAACDLALPAYTSELVDVGIQQGGIASAVPERISEQTMNRVKLFMEEADERTFAEAYVPDGDGVYALAARNADEVDVLNGIVAVPLAIVAELEVSGENRLAELEQALAAGLISKTELLAMKDEALSELGDLAGSMMEQRAILRVQAEYEALGMDLGRIRNRYLWKVGGMMLGVTFIMIIASSLAGLIASITSAKVGRDLRGRVFRKVVSFGSAEMDKFSTASLITRSTNDIQQVQMVIVMLLRMVMYAPILGIGGVLKVFGTDTGMSWIIGVALAAVSLLVGVLVGIAMPKFKRMQVLVDRLNLVSREILTGISVIRAFSREKHEEQRFAGANRDLMRTQLFTNRVMTFMFPGMSLIMNGVMLMIVWFGAHSIEKGNLQVGDMIAFISYTIMIIMSFMMLTMVSIMLPRAAVAAGRIEEVLRTEPSITDPAEGEDGRNDWQGVVEFRDVAFRFPGAERNALEGISFTARPGQITAVIGGTGSGKSTLVNLIPRFHDVTEGRIMIDGVDIRRLSQKTLRSLIGYVPQRAVLFSGTIASNLKFGGDDIPDDAMREAARIAQAEPFILEKEGGYDSPIAQGGGNVSGGQKQRLSIARAIAKRPKIFIFDDSFSALDYKTDAMLRKALTEKVKDATVIIVAQRISTIMHAEQIIVLDDGRVAGIGTHDELLAACPAYQEIARSQLSGVAAGLEGSGRL